MFSTGFASLMQNTIQTRALSTIPKPQLSPKQSPISFTAGPSPNKAFSSIDIKDTEDSRCPLLDNFQVRLADFMHRLTTKPVERGLPRCSGVAKRPFSVNFIYEDDDLLFSLLKIFMVSHQDNSHSAHFCCQSRTVDKFGPS